MEKEIKVIRIEKKSYDMDGNKGTNYDIVIEFMGIAFSITTLARKQGLAGIMDMWSTELEVSKKGGN